MSAEKKVSMGLLFSESLMQISIYIGSPLKADARHTTSVCPHPCISLEDSELVTLSQWRMLPSEPNGNMVLGVSV